jgi:copper chaperone CopZ
MTTTVLNVPDISCEHYERTITNTLQSVDAVRSSVQVNIPARQLGVEYDAAPVIVARMQERLQEEDAPVETVG